MSIRKQFEKCCVPSSINETGQKIPSQGKCLSFLNCFFGDPDSIDDEVKEFKFNKNVIELNHSLGSRRLLLLYSLNFIIYYFLVGFVPIYFRGRETVLWESHYIYAGYAAAVFLFETYLTYFIIKKVNSGKGNKILKDFSLANYLLPLILSQIKKYDFYTDVVFIITNINNNREHIAIISGAFLLITTSLNLFFLLELFKELWNISFRSIFCYFCQKKKYTKSIHPAKNMKGITQNLNNVDKFSTFMVVRKVDSEASNKNINLFCQVSSLLELECIGNCLDKFSTKNAWFFPYFGGYYIPQQIISSTMKFLFEDIPSFVIQIFVIAYYDTNYGNSYLLPIIITTCISLVASIITVLTAKASILKSEELKELEQEKLENQIETKRKEKEMDIEANIPLEEEKSMSPDKHQELSVALEGKDDIEEEKNLIDEKKNI